MAIFANALPDEGLAAINNVPDDSIPDVPSSKAYATAVYKLYRAGILTGVDEAHNCNPLTNIKRSEVATILTRMMNEDKRVKFNMGEEATKPEVTEPEVTKPEVTEPDVTKPENTDTTNSSEGGVKEKFKPTEDEEDPEDKGFLMYVEDVFNITNRGTVASGRVAKGNLKTGDEILIINADGTITKATVAAIEMFKKTLDKAEKGYNIGLLFNAEITKDMLEKGDTLIGADAAEAKIK